MARQFRFLGGWILPLALGCFIAFQLFHQATARGDKDFDASVARLRAVHNLIQERYVKPVDTDKIMEGALRGMMEELDPYSVYFSGKEFKEFMDDTRGGFGGVGIEIELQKGWLTVITPIEDTPAARAGILAGDVILKIDGESTEGITSDKAVAKIRGKEGTKVTLQVLHRGQEAPVDVVVTRALIRVESVKNAHLEDPEAKIGYIRVTAFQEETAEKFAAAVEKLRGQGMRALVIDLRGNPGGLLDEAVAMADLFVDDGVIVSTEGRNASEVSVRRGKKEGTLPRMPLAVLVNDASASASEIFAGAMKDHGLGKLVGERTYGKGSVQTIIPLKEFLPGEKDDGGVKITTAHYYTPHHTDINREEGKKDFGLAPDLLVETTEEEKVGLARHRRERPEPAPAPEGTAAPKPEGAPEAKPAKQFIDRQLEAALNEMLKELGLPVRAVTPPPPGLQKADAGPGKAK